VVKASYAPVSFSFSSKIAASWTVQAIPQGPGSSTGSGPVDFTDPAHLVFALGGYTVPDICANCRRQPQIYVYPANEMSKQNPIAATRIADLRSLLAAPATDLTDQNAALPFLPLFNAAQMFHAQVSFLSFQNGTGVRYLTGYAQGPMPIVNAGLFYTFQGLTNDGAWYVAAIMPVTHPNLSAYPEDVASQSDAFMTDPLNYINSMALLLNGLPANSFSPDLTELDSMISSFLVTP